MNEGHSNTRRGAGANALSDLEFSWMPLAGEEALAYLLKPPTGCMYTG